MHKKTISLMILLISLLFCYNISMATTLPDKRDNNSDNDVKVPILLYHNIMDNYDQSLGAVHISPDEFEQHMAALHGAGYHTITFQQYYDYVMNDEVLPEKPIIITFDDGYVSNYKFAYPVLKKYNMKATIFILTGRMGAEGGEVIYPHFTWEQAKEMQQSGVIDIQSHSDLHPDMVQIDRGRAQLELRRSKYLIQKELGKPCEVFAYPYGLYNAELQVLAEKAGYKIQCAVGDKGINTKEKGLKQLKRLTAFGGTTGEELLQMIEENMVESEE